MEKEKLILNGILYTIVTTILLILLIKEKKVGRYIKSKRDKMSDKLIEKLKLTGTTTGNCLKKLIAGTEVLVSAVILVKIIQTLYIGNFVVPTESMEPTILIGDRFFANMVIYNFQKPEREDIIVFKEPLQNRELYTKRVMGLPGEKVKIYNDRLYVNGKPIKEREYYASGDLGVSDYWIIPKKGDNVEIIPSATYQPIDYTKKIDVSELQKQLLKNPIAIKSLLPDVEFKVNGEKTGMLLDLIHNKKNLEKLISGKNVNVILDEDYYLVLGDNTGNSSDSRYWGFVNESRIKGKLLFRFWPINRMGFLK